MTKNRRDVLKSGLILGIGGTFLATQATQVLANPNNRRADAKVLNNALFYEHQAIAYANEAAQLKTPALITAGASIGSNEATHATVIRAAFKSLGVDLQVVPAPFVNKETRNAWIVKV